VVAVRIGKFWDGERVIDRPLVLIEGGPIKSVEAGDPKPPSGADVIDWSRYYGLPGLIDVLLT
jgi:imidazolonepropionase-like amidohydrolase